MGLNYPKPPQRPIPQRNTTFWRGARFATNATWQKGFRATPLDGPIDDQHRARGTWNAVTAANYARAGVAGGGVINPVAGASAVGFSDLLNRYDILNNGSFTTVLVTRPLSVDQPANAAAITKRDDNTGVGPGWALETQTSPSPDEWLPTVWDGAAVNTMDPGALGQLALRQTDVVVFIWNAHAQLEQCWINGHRAVSQAGATQYTSQNNDAIMLFRFGDPAFTDYYEGEILTAMHFARPLAVSEIQKLTADPHFPWRARQHQEFMFGPGAFLANLTYFLSF